MNQQLIDLGLIALCAVGLTAMAGVVLYMMWKDRADLPGSYYFHCDDSRKKVASAIDDARLKHSELGFPIRAYSAEWIVGCDLLMVNFWVGRPPHAHYTNHQEFIDHIMHMLEDHKLNKLDSNYNEIEARR